MTATIATIHTDALPGGDNTARTQVVVLDGPDRGRAAPIPPAGVVLGTDPECDLSLTDERASRRHLSLRPDGKHFVATDLGSTNGTLYEGSLITEARVTIGATFRVGRSFVRVVPIARALQVTPSRARRFGELVGESLAIREVFAVLELAAENDATVLLEGETGTGKELAARALHEQGRRRRGPFVAIDCGALPETLLESELFGHLRGSFTGAAQKRDGAFVRADKGTLFLDELGQVSPAVQARLLRAIEERKVRPVGGDAERAVDVRIVAASRHDLLTRIAEGSFRPDLYYRLSVVKVTLPPLRSRREDIAPIVAEILKRRGMDPGPVKGPALDLLLGHDWPGNVRELRNVIDRALALSPGARSFAELRGLGPDAAAMAPDDGTIAVHTELPWLEARRQAFAAVERRYLRALMDKHPGNVSAAARTAGIDRKHLRTLLKRAGLG